VGFDINCGVRLLRTNLTEADVTEVRRPLSRFSTETVLFAHSSFPQVKEQLAQSLFDHIPVGVGSQGIIPTSAAGLEAALGMGMDWCVCLPVLSIRYTSDVKQVAARRLRVGRGQRALRGVWPHAQL